MSYALLSTRNRNGIHPNFRGLGFLGDGTTPLSPTEALQQAISAYGGAHLNPRDWQNQAFLTATESAIPVGEINVTAYSPSCAGQAAPNLNLFQTASGLALGTTSAAVGVLGPSGAGLIASAAVPVIGWVVAGVGAIISLIGAIFAHHAAAVKRDLAFGCGTIPAVNNAFAVIAQGVQSGQIKPADASTALWEIYSKFMSLGGASGSSAGPGGIPGGGTAINDSPYCNSNCEISVLIYAMCLYWSAQYQAMAAQQAAVAAESAAQSASQGGSTVPAIVGQAASAPVNFSLSQMPAWGWIALAALGAWAVS
jgi:hypothetical protein